MDITLWDPFTALARLDREFDELVRRTWGRPAGRSVAGFVPACEIIAEGRDVVIKLELPGVDVAKDVDISVHEGRLVITGERRDTVSEKQAGVVVRELRYGSFRREFALPEGVASDNVDASYDQGILTVRVKNVARPQPEPTRVPINMGQSATEHKTIEGSTGESK
jgi:HSP20 family protein